MIRPRAGAMRSFIEVFNPSRSFNAVGDYYQTKPTSSDSGTVYRAKVEPSPATEGNSADQTYHKQTFRVTMRGTAKENIKTDSFVRYPSGSSGDVYRVLSFYEDPDTFYNVIMFDMVLTDSDGTT